MASQSCTAITDLPKDLLSLLFYITGIKAALSAASNNSKLHGAWQAAVRSVTLPSESLKESDVSILKQLVNLETVKFSGDELAEFPAWRVLAQVAPELARLRSIAFESPRAFNALPALACIGVLGSRLKELHVKDVNYILHPVDLWALADLKAVSKLRMVCKGICGEPSQLQGVCSKLGHVLHLELDVNDMRLVPVEVVALFPGSLTSLTSLVLDCSVDDEGEDDEAEEQRLASAVSSLSNLQRLTTSMMPKATDAQQRVLAPLKHLTYLEALQHYFGAELAVLHLLPDLVVVKALGYTIPDYFSHPSLQRVHADALKASDEWQGMVAEGCKIGELEILSPASLSDLQALPLLPALHRFKGWELPPSDGRYLPLTALLQRQASTLQYVLLQTDEPLEDMLPSELPACTYMFFKGAVSRATLQLLGMCCMPALRKLQLALDLDRQPCLGALSVQADLGWLRRLPALKVLELVVSGSARPEVEAAVAGLREAVAGLMQGSGVKVVL
jgi:hypothetical protein